MSAPAPESFSFEPLFVVVALALLTGYGLLARRERPSPARLALGDLCAVILNLNEFVYMN